MNLVKGARRLLLVRQTLVRASEARSKNPAYVNHCASKYHTARSMVAALGLAESSVDVVFQVRTVIEANPQAEDETMDAWRQRLAEALAKVWEERS